MVRISETSDGRVEVTNIDYGFLVDQFEAPVFVYEDTAYKRYIVANGSTILYKASFEESIYVPYTAPPALP